MMLRQKLSPEAELVPGTWTAVYRHIVEAIFYCRSDAELYVKQQKMLTNESYELIDVIMP